MHGVCDHQGCMKDAVEEDEFSEYCVQHANLYPDFGRNEMINAYRAGALYNLGEPWMGGLRQLATTPASGTFMVRGEYAVVEVGSKYVFPPIRLEFTTDDGVRVRAGDNFVILNHGEIQYILWRQDNIPNHPDAPMVA